VSRSGAFWEPDQVVGCGAERILARDEPVEPRHAEPAGVGLEALLALGVEAGEIGGEASGIGRGFRRPRGGEDGGEEEKR
jgi:hypothetical protein